MNILTKFLHKTENFLARKHWAGVAKYFFELSYTARREGLLALADSVSEKGVAFSTRAGIAFSAKLKAEFFTKACVWFLMELTMKTFARFFKIWRKMRKSEESGVLRSESESRELSAHKSATIPFTSRRNSVRLSICGLST